jgi:hypothetical protein
LIKANPSHSYIFYHGIARYSRVAICGAFTEYFKLKIKQSSLPDRTSMFYIAA